MKALAQSFGCLAATVLVGFSLNSSAAPVFFDNFDSYATGSRVGGQGGWQGWAGNNAISGLIRANPSGTGSSLESVAGTDSVHPFAGVGGGLYSLTVQQYLPSTSSGSVYTILMNTYGPPYGANLNWSVQMLADLTANAVGVFDGAGNLQGSVLPLIENQWVDLRFDMDLAGNSVSVFYNNAFMATFPWQSGGLNQLQALDLYPDESPDYHLVGPVYWDNIRLDLVPEPTTFSLLALAGLTVLLRRKLS